MADLLFILLCILSVIASIGVITPKHPVYSVLNLVVVFLCISSIFFLLKTDFIALALIMLYLGAIVVLFLFVIMMISDNQRAAKPSSNFYLWASSIAITMIGATFTLAIFANPTKIISNWSNKQFIKSWAETIGMSMFSNYGVEFIILSMILLTSIIGAVALTSEGIKDGKKRQKVSAQLKTGTHAVMNQVDFKRGVTWK